MRILAVVRLLGHFAEYAWSSKAKTVRRVMAVLLMILLTVLYLPFYVICLLTKRYC